MSICPKCGLPEELCVCKTIAKESQKITVSIVQKRYRKNMTVIGGIDSSKIDVKSLTKKMKSKLACGGTYKDNKIELQGDHRNKVRSILLKEGFPEDKIEIK